MTIYRSAQCQSLEFLSIAPRAVRVIANASLCFMKCVCKGGHLPHVGYRGGVLRLTMGFLVSIETLDDLVVDVLDGSLDGRLSRLVSCIHRNTPMKPYTTPLLMPTIIRRDTTEYFRVFVQVFVYAWCWIFLPCILAMSRAFSNDCNAD